MCLVYVHQDTGVCQTRHQNTVTDPSQRVSGDEPKYRSASPLHCSEHCQVRNTGTGSSRRACFSSICVFCLTTSAENCLTVRRLLSCRFSQKVSDSYVYT